jgi:hypothetical protein
MFHSHTVVSLKLMESTAVLKFLWTSQQENHIFLLVVFHGSLRNIISSYMFVLKYHVKVK